MKEYPDKLFTSYLISGLRYGFHTGIQNQSRVQTHIANNLLSAKNDPDAVSELLFKEVQAKYWIGPFRDSPFDVYRISPLGVVQHKYSLKKRLIVDLSAPHDNAIHPSLNELIVKEDYSLTYVKIDDAISIIKKLGQGAWLCKVDIKAAFKNLPILPSLWPYHGVQWKNNMFFATRLVFGSRSSPKIFDCLAQAVEWIAINNYGIRHMLHLLDDFLTIECPDAEPDRNMALLSHIFNVLGIPLAQHKSVGPVNRLEYLGIILDTCKMQACLPLDKKTRILDLLDHFLHKRTCIKRELLSLIGHLVFASRVIIPGRTFISRLIEASKKVKELHHRVTLTKDSQSDILMWGVLLKNWNGISLFLDREPTSAQDLHLYTDASGTLGFAGFFQGKWFASTWDEELISSLNAELSIAFQELYPIVVAAILWGRDWQRKQILFHCDNLAVVHILNKGRSPCLAIMQLMRRLVIVASLCNFNFMSIHVPGYNNQIADSLSRQNFQKFRQLTPEAEMHPCTVPPPHMVMFR